VKKGWERAMADSSLYETDIVAWADEQVAGLRRLAARTASNEIDWENVIEEIESVGRSQVNGVERKLVLIISHLLKVLSAPDSPACRGWRAEVTSFQQVVEGQFAPSMRQLIGWDKIWRKAQKEAEASLGVWGDPFLRGLPHDNPLQLDDLISPDFSVDEALATLARSITSGGTT
jgi:hypothetical protein